ncbi:unnamed protein product [Ranitomeya imitator]|uniref:Complex 1 LYR protein domain-containing protein n=1 Tax=Ranitomeya imitator TaxID=111125 RepID=A0ABN9MEH5_9NEOB|nr:unnamed protein product [Ranitomeya imitator]
MNRVPVLHYHQSWVDTWKFGFGFTTSDRRTYAIRRVRDAFREKKNVDDFHEIQSLIYRAKENLEVIQRQFGFYEPLGRFAALVPEEGFLDSEEACWPQIFQLRAV